jgi:predicted nucleic acid-binding protein
VNVVLDAWAVVALLRNEPAGPRVQQVIEAETAIVSSINLGEAYYILGRDFVEYRVDDAIRDLRRRVVVESPDFELVLVAAQIKLHHKLSYADAFCVATARGYHAPLWTGDPEIVALGDEVEVVDLR